MNGEHGAITATLTTAFNIEGERSPTRRVKGNLRYH